MRSGRQTYPFLLLLVLTCAVEVEREEVQNVPEDLFNIIHGEESLGGLHELSQFFVLVVKSVKDIVGLVCACRQKKME